jgi:hypothetical protein
MARGLAMRGAKKSSNMDRPGTIRRRHRVESDALAREDGEGEETKAMQWDTNCGARWGRCGGM